MRFADLFRRAGSAFGSSVLAMLLISASTVSAQERGTLPRTAVLVIDFEELFQVSKVGQSVQHALEERGRKLAEEIARIDAEMAAEELALTVQRDTLSAEEFRALADAFDQKVQQLRREQDARAQELNRQSNEEQLRFRQSALPVVGQLMLEAGAAVVIEKRNVLIFNDAVDVTDITALALDARASADTDEADPDQTSDTDTPDP